MNQSLKNIDTLVIHCSATPPLMDIGVKEIRSWHKDKNFADIGYQYVIRRNGTREFGRSLTTVGAHVRGHNTNSIGICLVGGVDDNRDPADNFTKAQKGALKSLIIGLRWVLPNIKVIQGHRDFKGVAKACPSFDVAEFLEENGIGI